MAKKKRIAARRTVQVRKKASAPKKKTAVKKKKTARKAPASVKVPIQRLVIHTNDITKILGVNIRTAQRLLQTIREDLGRKKNDYVSIKEFARHVHLTVEEVKQNLSAEILS
jgi:hypothetical protein